MTITEAANETAPRVSNNSTAGSIEMRLFLTRGLVAIAWAVVFATPFPRDP